MRINERLRGARRVFLDTPPIVYFVEANERYLPVVNVVFELLDSGAIAAVTSPVTLAECLVGSYRQQRRDQIEAFTRVLTNGPHTTFASIDWATAERAAELRARYNLSLADAFQIAAALAAGCDTFVTNDTALKRVTELQIVILDDMEF